MTDAFFGEGGTKFDRVGMRQVEPRFELFSVVWVETPESVEDIDGTSQPFDVKSLALLESDGQKIVKVIGVVSPYYF